MEVTGSPLDTCILVSWDRNWHKWKIALKGSSIEVNKVHISKESQNLLKSCINRIHIFRESPVHSGPSCNTSTRAIQNNRYWHLCHLQGLLST